jgi:hypothetical protein
LGDADAEVEVDGSIGAEADGDVDADGVFGFLMRLVNAQDVPVMLVLSLLTLLCGLLRFLPTIILIRDRVAGWLLYSFLETSFSVFLW